MHLQTAQYVIDRARTYLGDIVTPSVEPKFSAQQLLDFLNDGLEDIQDLKRKLFRTVISVNVLKDLARYDFSDYLLNIKRIEYRKGCTINLTDHRQLDTVEHNWKSKHGKPTMAVYDYTNPQIITLYPKPLEDDYKALLVYGDKKLYRLTLADLDSPLVIDDRLYKPLIHYIVAEASSVQTNSAAKCDSAAHRKKYEVYVAKINLNKASQDTGATLFFDYDNGFRDEVCIANKCTDADIQPTAMYITLPYLDEPPKTFELRLDILDNGLDLVDFYIVNCEVQYNVVMAKAIINSDCVLPMLDEI